MSNFNRILHASQEDLLRIFHGFRTLETTARKRPATVAAKLDINNGQLICAFGFNPQARGLDDIATIIGFRRYDDIAELRNEYFSKDIYKRLSLDNILAIHDRVKEDPLNLQSMQYLLRRRLESIEQYIEATVNSLTIEKYKAEIRAIYIDGIAGIDFAKERLNKTDSGFRALVNEVGIITESRLIPVGEIFFMDTILPEEKRRLLRRELIADELVEERLQSEGLSPAERKVLQHYLKQKREEAD